MNRRQFLASSLTAAVASPSPTQPNVVILLADDLGWADVGFHTGCEIQTPNLNRLAAGSTEIERFYSCPLCSPTRSALMTGRYPIRFGIQYTVVRPWLNDGLPVGEHTIAESFRAAGYQTAMAGKWHLGHARRELFPGSRGFDHSYGHFNGAIDYYTHEREGGLDWHRDGKTLDEPGYSTHLIGSEAVARIERRDRARPLFLYVPFNAPHSPLQAPKELETKYTASISDSKRRTFAAMVEAMDSEIGRILDALDREKMAGNTIVLFFSDNGGPTGSGARNTPLRGAKGSTWEGGMRVPALVRWPGKVRAGAKLGQVMSVIDVFPTLAAAAGVAVKAKHPLDGRNLWPALTSGRPIDRGELFFAVDSGERTHYAAYRGPWKLVRETAGSSGGPARDWLFRIADDPREAADIAEQNPQVVRDLAARLEKWQALHPSGGLRHSGRPPEGWRAPKRWADSAK